MAYIMGIDPGMTKSNLCAWAILDTKTDTITAMGELGFSERLSWVRRIQKISLRIHGEIERSKLDAIGIEMPWLGKDPQVTIKLGAQLGSFLHAAELLKVPAYLVQATEAMNALLGYSGGTRAIKKDVAVKAVRQRYGLNPSNHQADAIAVALHVQNVTIEKTRLQLAQTQTKK